jgi:hypothetical protein
MFWQTMVSHTESLVDGLPGFDFLFLGCGSGCGSMADSDRFLFFSGTDTFFGFDRGFDRGFNVAQA